MSMIMAMMIMQEMIIRDNDYSKNISTKINTNNNNNNFKNKRKNNNTENNDIGNSTTRNYYMFLVHETSSAREAHNQYIFFSQAQLTFCDKRVVCA